MNELSEQFLFQFGSSPSASEQKSWGSSLQHFSEVVRGAGLSQVDVLVEHRLPLTSKRVDVILSGKHPETGRHSFVVVELKQWSKPTLWEGEPDLVVADGFQNAPRSHPLLQVEGYREYMMDFVKSIEASNAHVSGIAYLHNAVSAADIARTDLPPTSRMFAQGDRGSLETHLRALLDPRPYRAAADELLKSKIAPSRQLMSRVAEQLASRDQFVLLDEQRAAVDLIRAAVEQSYRQNRKNVILITGGPGSGKSVIALSAVADLAAVGRSVLHATGSKSFTQTLRKVAGKQIARVQSAFKYFNSFMSAAPNELDVLILDEAHRIRATSANRYTSAAFRTGRSQIDELVGAARVPVFLLDENQVVRPGEMGSVGEISKYAEEHELGLIRIDLTDQFRCGGSAAYSNWVHSLLEFDGASPHIWQGDPLFEVRIVDSPSELEDELRARLAQGYGARMTAGFCWKWSKPVGGQLVPDVDIEGWHRPWNANSDKRVGDAPPAPLWATDEGGFGQIGCIYTAQGFEYDWNGVILGSDLVWRGNGWVANQSATKDPDLSASKVDAGQFDLLVRNVYKVLLTRGMQGTVIYSVDSETRDFLHSLVS